MTAPPLNPNTRRQAIDSLRGDAYQLWYSVLRWILLGPEEVLYLEGAEDLDVLSADHASTIQVKDRPTRTISLNTEAARQALENFLESQFRNPGRRIQYAHITTSTPATELGAPFGPTPGMLTWNRIAAEPLDADARAIVARVREVLREGASADHHPRLTEFLVSSTTEALHESLIRPVRWVGSQPTLDAVRKQVETRLSDYGRPLRIPHTESVRVASVLLDRVFAAATSRPPVPLDRRAFQEEFERATSMVVSRGEFSGPPLPPLEPPLPEFSPPRLPAVVYERADAFAATGAACRARTPTWLVGPSGSGKTTAALWTLRGLDSRPPLWISLREADDGRMRILLRQAREKQARSDGAVPIVLDDFPSGGMREALDIEFPSLFEMVLETNAPLLVTSAQRPDPRLLALDRTPVFQPAVVEIPLLTEDEVHAVLVAVGANESQATTWRRLVVAHTGGLMQLVVAYGLDLAARRFPSPTGQELLVPPTAVTDLRTSSFRFLAANRPADERELLARLDVIPASFHRECALAVATADPPVARPGEVFDAVAPSWLRVSTRGRYSVSALLRGYGDRVLAPTTIAKVRDVYVDALLRAPELATEDWPLLLLYASTSADSAHKVLTAATRFLAAPSQLQRAVAAHAPWLAGAWTESTAPCPIDDPEVEYLLRTVQLTIALSVQPTHVTPLLDILDSLSGDLSSEALPYQRWSVLHRFFGIAERCLPLARMVAHAVEFQRVYADVRTLDKASRLPDLPSGADGVFMYLAGQPYRTSDIVALLTSLGQLPRGRDAHAFWERPPSALGPFRNVLGMAWVREQWAPEADHDRCLRDLDRCLEMVSEWPDPVWRRTVANVMAMVLDESLHRPTDALDRLDREIAELGRTVDLLDARATVLLHLDRNKESLEARLEALDAWPAGTGRAEATACRLGGIAAGRIERWGVAAKLFLQASTLAEESGDEVQAAALDTDSAHALWCAGRREEAVALFSEIIDILRILPQTPSDPREYRLHKMAGHIIAWCAQDARGGVGPLHAPPPGAASDLRVSPEFAQLPPTPVQFTVLQVMELAVAVGDWERVDGLAEEMLSTAHGWIVSLAAQAVWTRLLHADIPDLRALNLAGRIVREAPTKENLTDGPLGPDGLPRIAHMWTLATQFAAMLRLDRAGLDALVATYRHTLETNGAPEIVSGWTESWIGTLQLSAAELRAVVKAPGSLESALLAGIPLCRFHDHTPLDSVRTQLHLVLWLSEAPNVRRVLENDLADWVRAEWSGYATCPALLRAPALTVPELRQALASSASGVSFAAGVMLAAADAAGLRLQGDLRQSLTVLGGPEVP